MTQNKRTEEELDGRTDGRTDRGMDVNGWGGSGRSGRGGEFDWGTPMGG
jgi:hypothetical protein